MRNSTSTLICSLSVEQDLRVFYFRFLSTKVEEFEKRLEDLRLIGGKFVWREIWLSFAVQRLVLLNGSGTRFGFNRCSQMLSKNVFCQKCLYIGHLEALTQFFCPSAWNRSSSNQPEPSHTKVKNRTKKLKKQMKVETYYFFVFSFLNGKEKKR